MCLTVPTSAGLGTETYVICRSKHLLTLLAGQGLDPAAARALFDGLEGNDTSRTETALLGPPRAPRRREKMFGLGRPRALDRNAKVRIMHWARCLSRRTEKGRAYGLSPRKRWRCSRRFSGPSTTQVAGSASRLRDDRRGRPLRPLDRRRGIKALEDAGVLSWVHRLKRVRVSCPDLFGADGVRVVPQRTATPTISRTPERPLVGQILLSPKSRLEQRTKVFSLR